MVEVVRVGQLFRNQTGTYWRVNSIDPATGFCWVEQCDGKGKPLGPFNGMYTRELLSPAWFLVEPPKPSRYAFWARLVNWLKSFF